MYGNENNIQVPITTKITTQTTKINFNLIILSTWQLINALPSWDTPLHILLSPLLKASVEYVQKNLSTRYSNKYFTVCIRDNTLILILNVRAGMISRVTA